MFSEAVEALPGCLHITIPDTYHAPVNHSQSTSRLLQHQCTRHMARLMIKPKPGRPAPGLCCHPACCDGARAITPPLSPLANRGVALLPLDPGQRCVVCQKQEGG